jgi:hypothetical protein
MKTLTYISILCLTILYSCENSSSDKGKTVVTDTFPKVNIYLDSLEPHWLDSSRVIMKIDTNLSYSKSNFKFDSIIILDYNGSFGEHSYLPLNDSGQWITTIKFREKLTSKKATYLDNIFGDKQTYKHELHIGCFQPGLGLIYYKDNCVIGQSTICIGCARILSTMRLGNKDYYASFNQETKDKLKQFYKGLNIDKLN